MKSYEAIIKEKDDSLPLTASELFVLSDIISEEVMGDTLEVIKSEMAYESKLAYILSRKKKLSKAYQDQVFQGPIRQFFHIDGAIKLKPEDMQELRDSMSTVIRNQDGTTESQKNDAMFSAYTEELLHDFTYKLGNDLIFRNPRYYFLLDGLDFKIADKTTSINDFLLTDIDVGEFSNQLAESFNSVHQHFILFSDFFFGEMGAALHKSRKDFCAELKTTLSQERLGRYYDIMDEGTYRSGSQNFDAMYVHQWTHALKALESLRELAEQFESTASADIFYEIVRFLAYETVALERSKIEFGIDLDRIFNKYAGKAPGRAIRKVLLGLLDAKINILAFCQNFSQIFTSDQFLNPDFPGSLVFTQSAVRNISAVCPDGFSQLKQLQEKLVEKEISIRLLREIDEHVGFYMDTLFEDNYIGYLKLMGSISPYLPELGEGRMSNWPTELELPLEALNSVFTLINQYILACEQKEDQRQQKNIAKGKPHKRSDLHFNVKKSAIKKLIRIYREENDPIVMIKAAQNALNVIIEKGFDPNNDVLHVMSINYGGGLVGMFAKHTFARTVRRGRVLCNPGELVYSIYDVKNANSFSGLADYPFSSVLRDRSLTPNIKERFAKRNWLLVFDDNTNSGQTLDDIRVLAEQSGFYSKIDLFPCRASSAIENYKKGIPSEQKLSMLGTSAAFARRSSLNRAKIRYKEKLGTIVGYRIFKLLNSQHENATNPPPP